MHRITSLVALALAASLPLCEAAAAETAPTPAPTPAAVASLPSAPTPARSWTARIEYPIAARLRPGGRIVAKLQDYTPYSLRPAIYMVTAARRLASGRVWIRIQLAQRPNDSQGWVPARAVTLRAHTRWVRINQRTRTVNVFRAGRRIKTFRAAVGTGGTPTPSGLFAVQDVVAASGQLGPYILTLTAHSRVFRTFAGGDGTIGIHGWPDSGALGKAVSHGCVRMSRDGVRALTRWASAGVPVEIVG